MLYGICNLSIVPVRTNPDDTSEMSTQLLYGDFFKILEVRGKWSRIRITFDSFEGWIDNKQYVKISEEDYETLLGGEREYSEDIINYIIDNNNSLMSVPMGSSLSYCSNLDHLFEGNKIAGIKPKNQLIDSALLYLNSPFLWGGKTPFGIDSSGFTQMVYKLNGYSLMRDAAQQSTQGEPLSFIEESEAGDLAFFDDNEGKIIHVGMMMNDNYIIHVNGKVRIDRIDHSGIFNIDLKRHTHQLRVIKKII